MISFVGGYGSIALSHLYPPQSRLCKATQGTH